MNYREVEILGPTDLGASGTKIIDLDIQDLLSTIELTWRTKVATVSDMTATHASCISKIELVDGSEILWSLSGEQAQALGWYGHGLPPLNDITVVQNDYMTSVIPIYFGRFPLDPDLAFDPKRFINPQLKITWDEDAANASVVVNELTVRAWAFDQKAISPRGFLMAKEIKAFTPVASAYEYTDLPTDYPYRLIMLRSASTDKNPFEVLDEFKLSEDHDKRVPFDLTGYEIFRKFVWPLGPNAQKVRLNETAGDAMALYLAPTYLQSGQVDYDADVVAADDDYTQVAYAGNKVTIAATVNYVPYLLSLEGYAPHFCMAIPLGRLDDIGDWFDPRVLGNVRLTTKGASAVGTSPAAQIVIQQLRA